QTIGAGTGKQSFQYDTYSRLWKSQDERGNTTEYQYDPWNRIKQVIYPNASEFIEYDDINRTKITQDGEGNRVRETYDGLGRTTQVARWKTENGTSNWAQLSSVKKYDYVGHALEATDANDTHLTKNAFDLFGRLTSVEDANQKKTAYSYGLANQITQVQYADGNQVQKQYDEMGRMIWKKDPSGLIDKYYYDGNSNLIKQVDRKGQNLEYQYNTRNFLENSISANETIGYHYDAAGRRLWMQDGTGKTSFKYYPATGLLDTMTYPDGRIIKYGYGSEGLGNRVTMTDPFGYNTVYEPDNRNHLKSVGEVLNNWDATYTYKKNGLLD
ncbi:type IV secretion protein Rhs, partial [Paenibacillus sp. SI92]